MSSVEIAFKIIAVYEEFNHILNHVSEYREVSYADGRETEVSGDKTPLVSLVDWDKGCLGFIFQYEKFGGDIIETKVPIEYFDIELEIGWRELRLPPLYIEKKIRYVFSIYKG